MWPFTSSDSPSSSSPPSIPTTEQPSSPSPSLPPPGHPPVAAGSGDKCPVDESTRLKWLATQKTSPSPLNPSSSSSTPPRPRSNQQPLPLPTDRETSSIPRQSLDILPTLSPGSDASSYATPSPSPPTASPSSSSGHASASTDPNSSNWVYPSEAQFYAAMERKNHNPNPEDMKTIVPIHNAVNERAWKEVMAWEKGRGGEECGGVKLVTFIGTPGKVNPKSLMNRVLFGYQPPFDTHRWLVNRCGTEVTYIIDFYTGSSKRVPGPPGAPDLPPMGMDLSFFLDVRPAVNGWEGLKMRLGLGRDFVEKEAMAAEGK